MTRKELISEKVGFYNTSETATLLEIKPTTLHIWHSNGGGPNRITGVIKDEYNRLMWPRPEVIRVMVERGLLSINADS